VPTTLDNLRAAVEGHTKRPLSVEDVAAIAALRPGPGGVRFEYVDETSLLLSAERIAAGAGNGDKGGFGMHVHMDEGLCGGEEQGGGKEVLLLEFLDGELKPSTAGQQKKKKKEPPGREERMLMRMPVFSQQQMAKLIERRNAKFAQAVGEFVDRCVAQGLDPEMVLLSEREAYIPRPRQVDAAVEGVLAADSLPMTIPRERKSIPEIVQELKESPWYSGQIVPDGHRVFEAQEAVYGELEFLLSQDLVNALYNSKGITRFYAHQAEAINALHEGHNVVVATSTSSGKSLIYQLPVLHALEHDHNTRAMYIFPTKALAQDQKRALKEMMVFMPGLEGTVVETFDGDTPMNERNIIRDGARIIFTNPDMLHITILPNEDKWRTFLKHLKYVVGRSRLPLFVSQKGVLMRIS
jgi:DEAD/DEAH box helicase domain-containing protein